MIKIKGIVFSDIKPTASRLTAKWLNSLQSEICTFIESTGLTIDEEEFEKEVKDNDLLLKAVKIIIKENLNAMKGFYNGSIDLSDGKTTASLKFKNGTVFLGDIELSTKGLVTQVNDRLTSINSQLLEHIRNLTDKTTNLSNDDTKIRDETIKMVTNIKIVIEKFSGLQYEKLQSSGVFQGGVSGLITNMMQSIESINSNASSLGSLIKTSTEAIYNTIAKTNSTISAYRTETLDLYNELKRHINDVSTAGFGYGTTEVLNGRLATGAGPRVSRLETDVRVIKKALDDLNTRVSNYHKVPTPPPIY